MANQPKFEIFRDVQGYYRWRLKAGNGEIVATSEAYTRRESASNSVSRIKELAPSAVVVDLTVVRISYR
jgi:uncharacterized protein YegP (UPF0339 family)